MKIIERTHNIETGEIVDIERDETAAETKARLDRLAENCNRTSRSRSKNGQASNCYKQTRGAWAYSR
jgi:hypothetical protein